MSKNIEMKYLELLFCLAYIYGCEASWYLTLRDKQRLMVFENRVLNNMCRPNRGGHNQRWGKVGNEFHNLYSWPLVTMVVN